MTSHFRWMIRLGIGAVLLLLIPFAVQSSTPRQDGVLTLQAPSFVTVAHAETSTPEGIAAIQEEAGIAAYFDKGQPITLSSVRGLFRTIEVETATYILGSMQATGTINYPESEDPHVYINTNGWVMAYYLNADPVSKIVDIYNYAGGAINTKLEMVLNRVAPGYTPTFYDFRYPNATKLLLVADQAPGENDTFTINLPSSFPNYYERGWAFGTTNQYCCTASLKLNDVVISVLTGSGMISNYGVFTPAQLGTDQNHTLLIETSCYNCGTPTGAITIVYRDVP